MGVSLIDEENFQNICPIKPMIKQIKNIPINPQSKYGPIKPLEALRNSTTKYCLLVSTLSAAPGIKFERVLIGKKLY